MLNVYLGCEPFILKAKLTVPLSPTFSCCVSSGMHTVFPAEVCIDTTSKS